MYKTILVPVDLSHPEHCKKTLGIAQQIGGGQSRIVALFVAADLPSYVSAAMPEGMAQESLKQARADLGAIAAETGAEYKVKTGHASQKILAYAEEIDADLIVIASHRPDLSDYFLGSTAARVVRHADCAVLVDR